MNTSDMPPPSALAGRLGDNRLGVEGAKAIAAVLKDAQLVHLEYTIPRHALAMPRQCVSPR